MLAAYFIYHEEAMGKQKLDDMVAMAFGGRYVLLLNGARASFSGDATPEFMRAFEAAIDAVLADHSGTPAFN